MKSSMKAGRLTISTLVILFAMLIQACDTKVNIEEPKRFYKLIGTDGDQFGVDMVIDGDDNVYILGTSTTITKGVQLYVVKTNPKGELLWEKMFGDDGDEQAKDIELTRSGDLMIVADHTDPAGERNFVIYRVSPDGAVVGTPKVDGSGGIADYANSITETSDGFVVAGYTDNGVYKIGAIYRYDASLVPAPFWNRTIEQAEKSPSGVVIAGYDVVPIKTFQVNDNEDFFYTFCYSNSPLSGDQVADYNFFVNVGNEFNQQRNVYFIHSTDPNSNERLTSVAEVPVHLGGGFMMVGYTSNPGSNQQDIFAMKIVRGLANIPPSQTSQYVVGTPRAISTGSTINPLSNASVFPSNKSQGYVIIGTQNVAGNDNIYLTKIDASQTYADAWAEPHAFYSLGGEGNDLPGAVIETSDGRILLCGTMVLGKATGQRKIVLMNVNPLGMFDE